MESTASLTLRPYTGADALTVVSWIHDEIAFYRWSAGRLGEYPISAERLAALFDDGNTHLIACDGDAPVGHIMLRRTVDREHIRFGYIIVDDTKRGAGYGRRMLRAALKYARESFSARYATLGVFEDNLPARRCYSAAGFVELDAREIYRIMGEDWVCIEMKADTEKEI